MPEAGFARRSAGRHAASVSSRACASSIKELPNALDDIEGMLSQNPIWRERTMGIGKITVEEWFPARRERTPPSAPQGSHGISARRTPTASYEQFDFNIPVGKHGDVYDRYLVRMAEMRESLKILRSRRLTACPKDLTA